MTSLGLEEAVALGYTLVSRVARDAGVRALAIKGPVLELQGLRPPHVSVDIDVLVDPARREELERRLVDLGWGARYEPTSAQILPLHSRTLSHCAWPCEIDLHDRYPGFFAPPATVFELLWEQRSVVVIAGVSVECPSPVASSAIAALHLLRDGHAGSGPYRDLLTGVGRVLASPFALSSLSELAQVTGAAYTLRPLLRDLGAPRTSGPDGSAARDREAWTALTASEGRKGVPALFELSHSPKRHWPRLVWRSLWLTEAEIREAQPDATAGRIGLLAARLGRLRRGAWNLPAALRVLRRARLAAADDDR